MLWVIVPIIIIIAGIFVGVELSKFNDQAPLFTEADRNSLVNIMLIEDIGKDIMNGK